MVRHSRGERPVTLRNWRENALMESNPVSSAIAVTESDEVASRSWARRIRMRIWYCLGEIPYACANRNRMRDALERGTLSLPQLQKNVSRLLKCMRELRG